MHHHPLNVGAALSSTCQSKQFHHYICKAGSSHDTWMPNWQAFVEAEQMYRLQQQQEYKTLLQQQHTEQQQGNSIRQNVKAAALQMYLQQQVSYIHTHTHINICKYVNVFSYIYM